MPLVWCRVGYIGVEQEFEPDSTEYTCINILDVTAKLVFILGEEFGVAESREVENLCHDAGDTLLSGLQC